MLKSEFTGLLPKCNFAARNHEWLWFGILSSKPQHWDRRGGRAAGLPVALLILGLAAPVMAQNGQAAGVTVSSPPAVALPLKQQRYRIRTAPPQNPSALPNNYDRERSTRCPPYSAYVVCN